MNGPAWVFLTAWLLAMLLLAIAVGANTDLAAENRSLRKAPARRRVPLREQVGPPPVTEVPDEFEESRPVDLHACSRCDEQGMFVDVIDGDAGWVVCGWCAGTGQRGPA